MKQMDLPDSSTPEAGAAYWDARLRSPECTDSERAEFIRWRNADPAHRAAFEELQRILHQLREVRHRPELRAIHDAALAQAQSRRRRAWFWSAALAASLVVMVTAAALWFGRELFNPSESTWHFSVETDVGEHRDLILPDGSTVSVGARSKLTVRFTDTSRSVEMEGTAYFTVVHEDTRPFVVRAGTGTITAIGTAFNVHQIAGRVVVIVVGGSVEVASVPTTPVIGSPTAPPARDAAPAPTRVQAGEQLVYGDVLTAVRAGDPAMAVAWREGHLKYLSEPLEFVIPDVQRYTHTRLEIADESVG